MAKNLGREFAEMSDDERRKFALEEARRASEASDVPEELEFEDPRDPERMGKQHPNLKAEVADSDSRDGTSALLDDEAHERNVERQRRSAEGQQDT